MKFKLVSKNNFGVALSLLLVILLSQTRVFNFLLVTPLGRILLISIILSLAYVNKILGVVAVLFVIVIFSISGIGSLEGFTDGKDDNTTAAESAISTSTQSTSTQATSTQATSTQATPATSTQATPASKTATPASKTATPATPATPTTPTTPATPATIANTAANLVKASTTSAEGFDIIGTENYIKRGKQSNQIPVSLHMRESENISPFDGSFTDLFSSFIK